jgi:A-kinase anchor protein 10
MNNVDDQRELLGLSKVALAPTDRFGQERKISARRKSAVMTTSGFNNQASRQAGFMEGGMARQQSKSVESDAMGLYEAYISLLAENPLPLDEQTRLQIEHNICREDGFIRPDSFQVAQDFVFQLMQQKYYPEFLKSQYMCRYQIEMMTSEKLTLHDILFHNISMGYFMQYLEQEGDVHNLEFWLTADSIQEQLLDQMRRGTYVADAAVTDCMVLYSRYFSLQATHPLSFGDHIRIDLEVNICREGGPLPSCFSAAQKIAFKRMEAHFLNFLRSELYYQHLSELLGAIRSDRSNTPRSSISEGSTGPPEIMSPEDKVRTSFSARLGVDCGENPDQLWQRQSKGLVIGRINEQGIYESDVEEQLKRIRRHGHRGMRQRLSRAMKKLIGNDETEKEEMAHKIAHMIVNSISQQIEQREQTERTRDVSWVASSDSSLVTGKT